MQQPDQFRVRPARMDDREDFAEMWTAFLNEQSEIDSRLVMSEDALQRWRNDFSEWIGANVHGLFVADHSEGGLIGFASVHLWYPAPIYSPDLEAYLDELYVVPGWRRRGVASSLLEEIKGWADRHEAERIRLGVLSANETALAFWRSRGALPFVSTLLIDV